MRLPTNFASMGLGPQADFIASVFDDDDTAEASPSSQSDAGTNSAPPSPDMPGGQYDTSDPNYHRYEFETEIGPSGAGAMTPSNTFIGLRHFPAPGWDPTKMVNTGNETSIPSFFIGGNVKHIVDPDTLTVTNRTLPGHIFHPGEVRRSIVEHDGKVFIRTVGEGTGPHKDLNMDIAPSTFDALDQQIKTFVNAIPQEQP